MELVTARLNDDRLILALHGRIDSQNAPETEKRVLELCAEYPTEHIVFDFDDVEYISSAGLRMILRMRKQSPRLEIENVSGTVYDIFDVTGFTEMLPVRRAFRKLSVDGCRAIGRGAKGTVYRYDDETIVKVYNDPDSLPAIQRERELARRAFVLGIPTAIAYDSVRVGGRYGSVFELLNAKSYSQLLAEDPDNTDVYVRDFAGLLRDIHSVKVKRDEMPDAKDIARKWLSAAGDYLTESDRAKLHDLIEAVPDTLNMLHCDYHTNNVMMQNGETILIDMDTLSHGHPIFELANVYACYMGFLEFDPENVEQFLGLPREEVRRVWNVFLPAYLGTDDPAVIADLEKKIKLLSYSRCISHTIRHSRDPEYIKRVTETSAAAIHELLQEVDTLEF